MAGALFAADFLAVAFLAVAFFAGDFLAGAFLAVVFFAVAFLAAAFLVADVGAGATAAGASLVGDAVDDHVRARSGATCGTIVAATSAKRCTSRSRSSRVARSSLASCVVDLAADGLEHPLAVAPAAVEQLVDPLLGLFGLDLPGLERGRGSAPRPGLGHGGEGHAGVEERA